MHRATSDEFWPHLESALWKFAFCDQLDPKLEIHWVYVLNLDKTIKKVLKKQNLLCIKFIRVMFTKHMFWLGTVSKCFSYPANHIIF